MTHTTTWTIFEDIMIGECANCKKTKLYDSIYKRYLE